MKLYIAQFFFWEEDHIIGIFSTKEKAEIAIQDFIKHNKKYLLEGCQGKIEACSILEYDLNVPNIQLDWEIPEDNQES